MSEKEKQTLDEISKAVSGMSEAEKARFLGIAEGMSIMKDMQGNARTAKGRKRRQSLTHIMLEEVRAWKN